ncbi:hypothetical protein ACFVVX_11920 [Kitasatospora sp. NPDC058170]|uniref:hypothetical protein n=1 Tax=Kitasatospora sp. NPDC058170 TaxID=3346364 RepID=UPI0036DCD516
MLMESLLARTAAERRRQAACAAEDLLAVLALAGAALPCVGVDWHHGRLSGDYLIDLGRARPEQVLRITDLLREGLRHERHHSDRN